MTVLVALPVLLPLAAQVRVEERIDLDAIYRIKEEGFQRSQVMDVASYLTNVHGPRLTNSPNMFAAAEYALVMTPDGTCDRAGCPTRRYRACRHGKPC